MTLPWKCPKAPHPHLQALILPMGTKGKSYLQPVLVGWGLTKDKRTGSQSPYTLQGKSHPEPIGAQSTVSISRLNLGP